MSNQRDERKKRGWDQPIGALRPALRALERAWYAPSSKFNDTSSSNVGVNDLCLQSAQEMPRIIAPDMFGALYMAGACQNETHKHLTQLQASLLFESSEILKLLGLRVALC